MAAAESEMPRAKWLEADEGFEAQMLGGTPLFQALDYACNVTMPDLLDAHGDDPEALAWLVALLDRAIRVLRIVKDDVDRELANTLGRKARLVVPGLGTVETHTHVSRKSWDHDRLTDAVARFLTVNLLEQDVEVRKVTEDGEVEPMDLYVFIRQAILGMYRETASPSWKTTGLKGMGIDPGDYCVETFGNLEANVPQLPLDE